MWPAALSRGSKGGGRGTPGGLGLAGPSSGAGAATRLPLPKMAAPLAVNSGKNNLSVGLRFLRRLSPRSSHSPAVGGPVPRLRARGTRGGRPGKAGRGEAARPGRAAGKGCEAAGAMCGLYPGSGRAELPGDRAPRSELPPCLAAPGGDSRQAAPSGSQGLLV